MIRPARFNPLLLVGLVAVGIAPRTAVAQATRPATTRPAAFPATAPAPAGAPVAMEFPAEGIELKTLVEIVARRLRIPILYDEQVNNKRVVLRVPRDLPESALLGVLQSALRMKQLALVDAEQPGWKQIVAAQNLAAVAGAADGAQTPAQEGAPLVRAFALAYADPARVADAVRPYLTQPGGSALPAGGARALIVADYPSAVARVSRVIALLDAQAPVEVRFVPLKQAEAGPVVQTVVQVQSVKEAAQGGSLAAAGIFLAADERTNQVVVTAPPGRVEELVKLIAGLDKPTGLATKVYRFEHVAPDRVDRLVRSLLGASAKRSYQSSIDPESQALVVAAAPDVHATVASVLKDLDRPAAESQSPIRFYKLKNTTAADVLATVSGLLAADADAGEDVGVDDFGDAAGPDGIIDPRRRTRGGGSSRGPGPRGRDAPALGRSTSTGSQGGIFPDVPGAVEGASSALAGADVSTSTPMPQSGMRYPGGDARGAAYPSGRGGGAATGVYPADAPTREGTIGGAVRGVNTTVAADPNTNSIIVIAPPDVQQQYADLIRRLDQRRPQVQLECTIVTLDTTDNFTLGVDVGRLGGIANSQLLSFSSFGVSNVNAATGALTPVNGPGGTLALLSPDVADVVLRALKTSTRARLMSAPQLLVNDNGKGKLQSVSQEPFAEILDTSTTQSRTGLGGQAQAGTTISVEPHISEGDYLQLAYAVELSSFTGQGANGLPPPSLKNAVESTVTIPDGHTIVVGGLAVKNLRTSVDTVPILGEIPIIKYLFGARTRSTTDTTLFVFIRPVILRDDKFEDLKHLSDQPRRTAGLADDFPTSEPIPLR